jgi:hypothetical protein
MDRRLLKRSITLFATGIVLACASPAQGQTSRETPQEILKSVPSPVADNESPSTTVDELSPVEVPIPNEKALRFYRSGMWIWALSVCWRLVVPALIAFTGFSTTLRNLARGLGRFWFPTVGLYVVLYLAIDFLIDLPLRYYVGFVR